MSENTDTSLAQRCKGITNRLFDRQDGASLAVWRIMFGVLLMRDVLKGFPYIKYSNQDSLDDFRSSFYGFEWVQADPTLIYLCVTILPFAVFCIILGLFYRLAMPMTAIIVGYSFLISPEYYLNHYYLLLLFCILMSFIPANKVWSIDSLIQKQKDNDTGVPAWGYLILKLQTEVMLIYAGLVKINPDWLSLQPLGTWLRTITQDDMPFVRWLLFDTSVAIGAYGVMILHIVGAPLLFWSRTRIWIFAVYVCFHLSNSVLFNVGIFPYMTIAATLLFFNTDWPRKIVIKLEPLTSSCMSLYGKVIALTVPRKIVVSMFCIWMFIQILMPLPALLSSNVKTAWNSHRDFFSWRMMLNNKEIYTASFVVHMPQRRRIVFVTLKDYLSKRQCFRVIGRPNEVVQFANYLEDVYRKKYDTEVVKVHAYITMSINFRVPEVWTDPTVNLAAHKAIYGVPDWLEPMDNPLLSWNEYIASSKYNAPTYREILGAMNLQQEEVTTFDVVDVSLDSRVVKPTCE